MDRTKTSTLVALTCGACLLSCMGSTKVRTDHPAIDDGDNACTVYMVRPGGKESGNLKAAWSVQVDNTELLTLRSGEYVVLKLAPGTHQVLLAETRSNFQEKGSGSPVDFPAGGTVHLVFSTSEVEYWPDDFTRSTRWEFSIKVLPAEFVEGLMAEMTRVDGP